jgi:hypothetical protein
MGCGAPGSTELDPTTVSPHSDRPHCTSPSVAVDGRIAAGEAGSLEGDGVGGSRAAKTSVADGVGTSDPRGESDADAAAVAEGMADPGAVDVAEVDAAGAGRSTGEEVEMRLVPT